MKNLFNPEAPFFQFLSRVGDLIILNLLFLVCSLPIVTMGASLAAMYKVVLDIIYETDAGTAKGFFKAFKENFRQATIVWVMVLIVVASLVCDLLLIMAYFGSAKLLYWVLALLALVVLGVESYMLPLVVRYRNSLKEHLSNAIVLAVIKFPRTLLMVLLNMLPFIIFWISISMFIQTLIFWVFIGFGFVAYVQASLLKPIFDQLEAGNEKVTIGM